MEVVYTVNQIADNLKLSPLTVRRYINSGKLGASKIGKEYRIRESDLTKLLDELKVNKG